MEIIVKRVDQSKNSTYGKLYLNGEMIGFTLEDIPQKEKIQGRTRIPAGNYPVKLRYAGGLYSRYSQRFKNPHPILHIQDVPGFEWIYFHIGNTHEDSSGCILVGTGMVRVDSDDEYRISNSTSLYRSFHQIVSDAIQDGDEVVVTVLDESI